MADAFAALGLPGRADVVLRALELYPTAGARSADEPEETDLERLESRYSSLSATA